ncbi:hypothetical protein EB796_007245 [Bugula neritina]|uniref:Sushi domain-containing protein n=1 Tax=Bugula neritina TaxID=10212 RepID=A0A7J7K861_BUGNE|nr:hypothetical protein EB796_007245 [Bugula neritina]
MLRHILTIALLSVLRTQSQTTTSSLDCTSPPYIANANHSETGTSPGSIATYTCYPGFRTIGSVQKTCRNRQWVSSGPSLYCQGDYSWSIGLVT